MSCEVCKKVEMQAYYKCNGDHIVCADCIFSTSKTKKYLTCSCGTMATLYSFKCVSINETALLRRYIEYYKKKYYADVVVIGDKEFHQDYLRTIEYDLLHKAKVVKSQVKNINRLFKSKIGIDFPVLKLENRIKEYTRIPFTRCKVCGDEITNGRCESCNIDSCSKCRRTHEEEDKCFDCSEFYNFNSFRHYMIIYIISKEERKEVPDARQFYKLLSINISDSIE